MNNPILIDKFKNAVFALRFIKVYNIIIMFSAYWAFHMNFNNLGLIILLFALNCFLNLWFFKYICDYMNTLNQLMESANPKVNE